MKTLNTLGQPISSNFNAAWDNSSINAKAQVVIEFGNNSFNATATADQIVTASSEKIVHLFPSGNSDPAHFWGPDEAFNNKNRNSMRWAVLDCGAIAWGPTSTTPAYRCVNTDDTAGHYEHGWWSAINSFPATITSIFQYSRSVNMVTVYTDEAYANMSSIKVQYTTNGGASWTDIATLTPAPTAYINSISIPTVTINGLRAIVNSSYGTDGFARISELQGYLTVDVSTDVISVDIEETREQYDSTVPIGILKTGSCNIVLQNTEQKYSPANPSSPYYPYVGYNNRVVVNFGIDETLVIGSNPPATALKVWPFTTGAGTGVGDALNTVDSGSGGATLTGILGNGTWVELSAAGNNGSFGSTSSSEPSPTGNGWLLNNTTLEGQTFPAGTWSVSWGLGSFGGLGYTIDGHLRVFRFNSLSSTYTLITEIVQTGIAFVAGSVTFSASKTASAVNFGAGDKLYVDFIVKIINDGGGAVVIYDGPDTTSIDPSITTPGYQVFVEYVQMGEYFTDQWTIDGAAITASVGARDYGKFMQDELVPFSKVWTNQNISIPLKDLLARVGKTPSQINIDQFATRIFPLLYVYNMSYWNWIAEVALADMGTFGFDNLGNFFYFTFSQLLNPPYLTSVFSFGPTNYIIDGSQETQLIINIVEVDVHAVSSLDYGLEALWQENTQRTIPATVSGGSGGVESSQPVLSWNYLASTITANTMTIPASLSNQIQDIFNPNLGTNYNSVYILIDNEVIYCNAVDTNNFYVYPGNPNFPIDPVNNPTGRGWAGTVASGHSAGAYIGQAEYYKSAVYDRGPAISVTGIYCTAIDGLELAYGPGMAQAKIIEFKPDLFRAEMCIANIVPAFTPLKASGVDSFNPQTGMYRAASATTGASGDSLNWVTSINGIGILQRQSPRRAGSGNLTNKRLIRRHGRAEIEINNPWIQTQAHADQIANFLIQQYNIPRSVINMRAIANPILDLSDHVTITSYPEGGITARDYNIMNISYTYDGALIATYSLKDIYNSTGDVPQTKPTIAGQP